MRDQPGRQPGRDAPDSHVGQVHDYVPDFIVRLKAEPVLHVILETKGFDPPEDVKMAAAKPEWPR